jgi:CspA family cold shock protein
MSSEQDTSNVPETQPIRLLGQVKWFNNKAGYGFITVNDGEYSGKDIFIHYSTIRVTNSQYKYLVQGEYVEFSLVKSTTGNHEFQAVDVSGIKGGSLMCETRRNNRPPRDQDASGDSPAPRTNQTRRPRPSGNSGPSADSNGDFTPVVRRRPNQRNGTRPQKSAPSVPSSTSVDV